MKCKTPTRTITFEGTEEMFPWAPMTKVVVRNVGNNEWRVRLFLCKCPGGGIYPFIVVPELTHEQGNYRYCIPYAGNEHLEGTCEEVPR